MKVKKVKPAFTPIVITLESQQEINELYAILSRGDLVEAIPELSVQYKKLIDFTTEDYREISDKISNLMSV